MGDFVQAYSERCALVLLYRSQHHVDLSHALRRRRLRGTSDLRSASGDLCGSTAAGGLVRGSTAAGGLVCSPTAAGGLVCSSAAAGGLVRSSAGPVRRSAAGDLRCPNNLRGTHIVRSSSLLRCPNNIRGSHILRSSDVLRCRGASDLRGTHIVRRPCDVWRSASDDLRCPILCGTNILRSTDDLRGTNILRGTDGLRGNRGVWWWVHVDGARLVS